MIGWAKGSVLGTSSREGMFPLTHVEVDSSTTTTSTAVSTSQPIVIQSTPTSPSKEAGTKLCDNCRVEKARKRVTLITGAVKQLCQTCCDQQTGVLNSPPQSSSPPAPQLALSRPVAAVPRKSAPFKMPAEPFSMNLLTRILAERAFSDEMIWTGHAALFPVLHQFKPDLAKYAKANNPLCTIWFYLSAEVVGRTPAPPVHAFRIAPSERVGDVIGEVLARLAASKHTVLLPAKKCRLETEAGYKLRANARLCEFGVGSLLSSWRLELKPEPKKAELLPPELTRPKETSALVEIRFPPLAQLGGRQTKTVKVDVTIPVRTLIQNICTQFAIAEPETFGLSTVDFSPNILLDETMPLYVYGLGTKFTQKLVLRLNYKTVEKGDESVEEDVMFSVYRYVQLPISQLDSDESRRVIKYLDSMLRNAQARMLVERLKRRQAERQLLEARKDLRRVQKTAMVAAVQKATTPNAPTNTHAINSTSNTSSTGSKISRPSTAAAPALSIVPPTSSSPILQSRCVAPPPPLLAPPTLDAPPLLALSAAPLMPRDAFATTTDDEKMQAVKDIIKGLADRVQRQQQSLAQSDDIDTVTPLVRHAVGGKPSSARHHQPTPMKRSNAPVTTTTTTMRDSDDDDDDDNDDDDVEDDDESENDVAHDDDDDDDEDFAPTGVVAAVLASRSTSKR